MRSTDYGKTWPSFVSLELSPYDGGGAGWSHVHQLPDGTVLLTVTLRHGNARVDLKTKEPLPDDKFGIHDHIYRSRDSGRTWGDRSLIVKHSAETSVLRLKSGKLLAAIRCQRAGGLVLPGDDIAKLKEIDAWEAAAGILTGKAGIKHAFLADSYDNGYTWTNLRLAPMTPKVKRGLCPSELVQLPDGRVVWVYIQKALSPEAMATSGIYARVSSDDGQTWSSERYRVRLLRDKKRGVYPASTVLKDGTILTLTGGNRGNRALAVGWRIPKK